MARRITLGAVTKVAVDGTDGAYVELGYRRAGLWHILMSIAGIEPRGTMRIDGECVHVDETSRTRRFKLTIPTNSIRAFSGELSRRLSLLIGGAVLFALGVAAVTLGSLERADSYSLADRGIFSGIGSSTFEAIMFGAGGGVLGLALLYLLGYSFRRDLVLRFDTGGAAGTSLHLRRSWSKPLPFNHTVGMIDQVGDIVLAAHRPKRVATADAVH